MPTRLDWRRAKNFREREAGPPRPGILQLLRQAVEKLRATKLQRRKRSK